MSTIRVGGRSLTPEEIKKEIAAYGHVRSAAEFRIAESQLELKRVGMMLLNSPDGRLLLDILEEDYYKGDLRGKTPEDSYFNLGQREVVRFLIGLRDQAKEP